MEPEPVNERPVVVEDRKDVRWITLNRPHVHNAQTPEMIEMLCAAFNDCLLDPMPRAVVLTGAGRSFCSGHDTIQMSTDRQYRQRMSSAEGRYREEQRLFVAPVQTLRDLPMPTVCSVRGHCLATGLALAAAADLTIASETAVFGSSLIPQLGINDSETPTFTLLVGERAAKQFLWLDDRLTAHDALRIGLVNWTVPDAELEQRTSAVAERLSAVPRAALMLSKQTMRFMADQRGEGAVGRFHYIAHQLSHHTDEARQVFGEYLRSQTQRRDEKEE